MARRLQRLLGPVQGLTPGQYTTETTHGQVAIACPGCGGISDLEQVPTRLGVVPLRWACPYAGCSYLGYLSLEAWLE